MTSMTFGTLPGFAQFEFHFKENVPDGQYRIGLGLSDSSNRVAELCPSGEYSAQALYVIISDLAASGDETCELFASSLMFTLGFEWI